MSLTKILATTRRVLNQLRHDPRTLGIIIVIPCVLMIILKYIFQNAPTLFNMVAPMLLGIFPLFMMFLVTSITTLRERTQGTLDRLMTLPMSKGDFMFGYALAFSLIGLIQACVVGAVTLGIMGVSVMGGTIPVLISAMVAAFLGTSLGLFVSSFAKSEFQAVELVMPILMPQVLLCGLFVSRDQMAKPLQWLSNIFPLTYSVDAMKQISTHSTWSTRLTNDVVVILVVGIAVLVIGSMTIRRRT